MQNEAKAQVTKRLQRIEGQVRGLGRMVEEDRYCIDIVTQIAATRAALRRLEEEILKDHVGHCVEHAIASGNKAEQRRKIDPLMGYTTSGDMKSQIRLTFETREEAIAYATREGIAFRVQEPKEGKRRQISYAENFRYDRRTPWTH